MHDHTQPHLQKYTLTHLSDAALLRELAALVAQDRITTASLLAHIAEVDARRLHVPAGYSSMHAYCVDELHLSDDAAYKRIQAARAARQFPALFEAVAEGRLHLAAVCLLAPHLTADNAEELIEAATHRRKSEIEAWLARRFAPLVAREAPRAVVRPVMPARPRGPAQGLGGTAGGAGSAASGRVSAAQSQLAPGQVETASQDAGGGFPVVESPLFGDPQTAVDVPARAAERYIVQVTISKTTHDKLCRAQVLLSHAVPSGDVAQVLDRALEVLIGQLERRKLGADRASRPSRVARTAPQVPPQSPTPGPTPQLDPRPRGPKAGSRYIAAPVRRAVWERDQGQCTFVSASGTRCQARRLLEFDHVEPFARGGKATVEGLRLRCRAHNQYEAERAFGADFMNGKRARSAART